MALKIVGIAYREREPVNEAERTYLLDQAWWSEMNFMGAKMTFTELYIVENDEEAELFMIADDAGKDMEYNRFKTRDAAQRWLLDKNIG